MHVHFDPFEKFDDKPPGLLVYLTKIIIQWAQLSAEADTPIDKVIEHHYGYPLDPFGKEGHVDEKGIYFYPGDPDLYPIAVIENPKETIFCYMHEIICIRNKGTNNDTVLRVD